MAGVAPPTERDRAILRSFRDRIDAQDPGAANNLGVLYFIRGMIEDSVALFTRALELDGRMTVAQRNLEVACFSSGYYDRRVRELAARLAAAPGDRAARWEFGRTSLLLGDVANALEAFGLLLRDDPLDVAVIRQVATAEAKCGDLEAAERWLEHALRVAPDDAGLLFHLGEVAYHRGLNDRARIALEQSVLVAPDDADAWYLLAFVRGDLGDAEGAMAARQQARRLAPSLGTARANLSLERFDARSWSMAREERAARGLVPPPPAARSLAQYHLALAFRQKGYLREALKAYADGLARGEEEELVRHGMAQVHLLLGEMAAALDEYERLLELSPERARYWNERGVALHHVGRLTEARVSYERAATADAHSATAHANCGVAAFQAGDAAIAERSLRRAISLMPSHVGARLNLALLLSRVGEPARALAVYREVLEQVPGHAGAWNGAGLVLTSVGRYAEARNAFARAVESAPDSAEARYNLGFVLSRLGEHAAALRETTRAMELGNYYPDPRFELSVDLEHEQPRFEVPMSIDRDAAVAQFTFEPAALESLFDSLVTSGPTPTPAADRWAEARAHGAAGRWDDVHTSVRRAVAAGGAPGEGARLQAEAFLAQGMPGEALERWRAARDGVTWTREVVLGEMRTLVALRRHDEAIPLVEWLFAQDALTVDSLLLAAEVLRETGQLAEARQTLEAAARLDAQSADVAMARSAVERDAGAWDAARGALQQAVTFAPRRADCRTELAILLMATGAADEALPHLVEACAAAPDYAPAHLALARLRRDRGEAAHSIGELATFLVRHPWDLDGLASLAESLAATGADADARIAVDRVLRFDALHPGALHVDALLRRAALDFAGALQSWRRVIDVEPASEYARLAAQAMAETRARRRELLGAAAAEVG